MLPRPLRAPLAALATTAVVALTASATMTPDIAGARPQASAATTTIDAAAQKSTGKSTGTKADKGKGKGKNKDPRRTQGLFVDQRMPAVTEGETRHRTIAKRSQALWLGIEYYPTHQVRDVVRDYTFLAAAARKTPVLVVYSIPDRDCGQHSAGGAADAASYKAWVKKVAAGIRGSKPLVVLEPDAIPFIGDPGCEDVADRLALLRFAVKRLSAAGAWVYLDAGHSDWRPYDGRALLLKRAGVGLGRGIATNVSNFRSLRDELAYGTFLRRELKKIGVTGVKQVVDTSRNGAPIPVAGDVINPTWARLGKAPKMVFDGGLDGRLWVKHPGESDGAVNGGPGSGLWCDLLADRLLGLPESGGC
ncbi:endoglucanase [Nocardioides sp. zg-579]|uniref:Glucanase n=1 Tax=Nocardioides marmotae TaxID=2663857 RepID=A0A6I3JE03_9ACTN|nr:glycoside hydrolase family 6 protein [Nocardioides marmotae]MCR6032688.1 endoglucanase [Gordonia jinghuaiqii]MTB96337.1 endoglucanase [Nocardioides marmotae]QKE03179.1 endoglucanase [Nocardioides marmotae]